MQQFQHENKIFPRTNNCDDDVKVEDFRVIQRRYRCKEIGSVLAGGLT